MQENIKDVIKMMENEKRKKVVPVAPEQYVSISFEIWWIGISKKLNLKSWMKEIILADFKGRGLTEKELPAKYDEALKLFGL